MNCLVTGGAGFIGSHIVDALVERGHHVRVIDNLSTGRKENLARVWDKIEFLDASISDETALRAAVSGRELVFHLAALVSVPESVANPVLSHEINDSAVLNLYRFAAESGVRRLVYSSSAAVYGNQPIPHRESLCPDPVESPYAMHKLLGEHYGRFFHTRCGLTTVFLRYFNVYGPRQNPGSPYSGVISIFMQRAREGRPVTIYGDGEQTRDFVYVSDVVAANLLAAFKDKVESGAYNIATGEGHSINELLALIQHFSNGALTKNPHEPARVGDIKHSLADASKAETTLGFVPAVSFREGIGRTWRWYTVPQYPACC